ncbi:MAG: fibronectin type III domain-containing protein [Nitrospirae bacterium]|nr:fibronectin type III domain-containing protein [Nitrospirota bacterium]
MRSPGPVLFFIAAFILLTIAGPRTLLASDTQIIVNNAADAVCSTTATPACYRTIQEAIDNANYVISNNTGTTVTYSILVEPGTYSEVITLKPGVSIVQGRETARTILNNSGNAPVVTASNLSTAASFRNFSFINTSTGIVVSNSSSVINITNNVFYGTSGAAITIQGSASTNVINNTFYQNGTAVVRDSASNQITNNIFSNNTVNISGAAFPTNQSNITYNDFNPAPGEGVITDPYSIPRQTITNPDPLFVDISDISHLDVHLKTGSPCIGNGDPNRCTNQGPPCDIGAYGGANADTIPLQVSNITKTTSSTSTSLTWNANLSYSVTGYRIYYGKAPGVYTGTDAAEGPSPINVTVTTTTLSNLSTTVVTPTKPALNSVTALNGSLALSWDAVPGATGYRVYCDIDDGTPSPPTTLNKTVVTTAYTVPDLTNNTKYKIAVSAIAQATYFIAVTAVNSNATGTSIPGIAYESAYSPEISVPLGDAQESVHSDFIIDYPEALAAYPNLQNSRQGCFIATAAYGCYSAPEVQALRAFRDRYLLTNSAGSAFVQWYYEHGPVAAAWLDAHPGYKPVVRTALMPAVGLALFMTGTSLFIKAVVALFMVIIALIIVYRFSRKRLSGSGGAQCKRSY